MWTRKELKQQAKEALLGNYWRIVLVALLLIVLGRWNILGDSSYPTAGAMDAMTVDDMAVAVKEQEVITDVLGNEISMIDIATAVMKSLLVIIDQSVDSMDKLEMIIAGAIIFCISLMIVLCMIAVMFVLVSFLVNPLVVGAQRFMLKSLDGRAEVKEVAYAFDHSYRNVVKVMFRTLISIFLWSFLFLLPGVYKKYQYRMVEYILAERPDIYYKDAMQLSKEMMEGEKWHAFVLDLSFILWKMAGVLTCGVVNVLFVTPYQYLTNAALYRRLRALHEQRYPQECRCHDIPDNSADLPY